MPSGATSIMSICSTDVADDVRDLLKPFALPLDAGPKTVQVILDRLDPGGGRLLLTTQWADLFGSPDDFEKPPGI